MITFGIDPGARHIGWGLLDMRAARAARIDGGTIDLKGRPIAGVMREIHDMVRGSLLVSGFDGWGSVTLAAVEALGNAFPKKGFGPRMAGNMIAAKGVEREIVGMLRVLVPRVEEVRAGVWRVGLCGRNNPSNAEVKAALAARVELPKKTTNHERDALSVGFFCGMRVKLEGMRVRRAGGA